MTWPQVGAIVGAIVVALEFVIFPLGGFGIDVFEVAIVISRGTLSRRAIGTALSSSSTTIAPPAGGGFRCFFGRGRFVVIEVC